MSTKRYCRSASLSIGPRLGLHLGIGFGCQWGCNPDCWGWQHRGGFTNFRLPYGGSWYELDLRLISITWHYERER